MLNRERRQLSGFNTALRNNKELLPTLYISGRTLKYSDIRCVLTTKWKEVLSKNLVVARPFAFVRELSPATPAGQITLEASGVELLLYYTLRGGPLGGILP